MWNIEVITNSDDGSGFTVLKLPSATRNISTKMNKSTSCVLSAKNVYAIAGKSKLLVCMRVRVSAHVRVR